MGTLFIVATPIGNLEDITIRAIKTLFSADIIACEDTRRTGLLLQGLTKRYTGMEGSHTSTSKPWKYANLLRVDEHTEQQNVPKLIDALTHGRTVALVSDAGTPLVSDPGFLLVREAIKRGIKVVSVPGPTAAIAALTSSGLPTDKFFFLGYPPEKSSHRIKLFDSLLILNRFKISTTYILYCAPHKLEQTLEDMKNVFGDIEIVVARELTKVYEEVWRSTITNAESHFVNPKGEFVILFNPMKERV